MLPMHAGACRDATNTRRSTYRSYTWVREHVGLLPMGEGASRDARKWLGSIVGILVLCLLLAGIRWGKHLIVSEESTRR